MDSMDSSALLAACGDFGGVVFIEITLSTCSGSGSAPFFLRLLLIHIIAANIESKTVVMKKKAVVPIHITVVSETKCIYTSHL